jgi:hypothetical protein
VVGLVVEEEVAGELGVVGVVGVVGAGVVDGGNLDV